MAKILLVEDDNNLREIYEARLQAEGYTIVSAQDGEEALVKAKQERPDLIISDVMMPRISGFEMLDILRNTEGLKDAKVIMLTALGQAEDKTRADALGADRYLVKSQVTLEDIVKAADELLNNGVAPADSAAAEPAAPTSTPAATVAVAPEPAPQPTTMPVVPPPVVSAPAPTPVVAPTMPSVAPMTMATPPAVAPTTPEPTATTTSQSTPTVATPVEPATAPSPAPMAPAPVIPVATPPTATAPTPGISMPQTPATTPAPTVSSVAPQQQTPAEPTPEAVEPPVTAPAPVEPAPVASAPAEQTNTEAPKPEETPAEAPKPETTGPAAPQVQQDDDKMMADAMKELTATLGTVAADTHEKSAEAPEKAAEPAPTATPAPNETAPVLTSPLEPASAPAVEPADEPTPETPKPEETPDVHNEAAPEPKAAENDTPESPEPKPAVEPTPSAESELATPETNQESPEQPPVTPDISGAAATADEQALMQQQIDSFIKQQDGGAPQTTPETPETSQTPDASEAHDESSPTVISPSTDTATPTQDTGTPVEPADDAAQDTLDDKPATPELTDSGRTFLSSAGQGSDTQDSSPAPQTYQPTTPKLEVASPTPAPTSPADNAPAKDEDGVNIAHKKMIQPPVEPMSTQPDLNELLAREGINNLDEHGEDGHPTSSPFAAPPHQPGHVISPNGGQGTDPDDPNNIAL